MKILLLAMLVALTSCAKVRTLNMKPYNFGVKHDRIVWLQISGLDPEQLPLIRFTRDSASDLTSFEKSNCLGMMWTYDLKDLRPSADAAFYSQITGRKIQNENAIPVWKYLDRLNFVTGVLDMEEANTPLTDETMYVFKRAYNADAVKTFNYTDKDEFSTAGIYYDQSCSKNHCVSINSDDVMSVYRRFISGKGKTLFIYRDNSIERSIKNKNSKQLSNALRRIDDLYGQFIAQNDAKTLVLVTSGAPLPIELPRDGRDWQNFQLKRTNLSYKKSALVTPVYAYGAGAENFCGVMEESEILKRIIWSPDSSQLGNDIKNVLK